MGIKALGGVNAIRVDLLLGFKVFLVIGASPIDGLLLRPVELSQCPLVIGLNRHDLLQIEHGLITVVCDLCHRLQRRDVRRIIAEHVAQNRPRLADFALFTQVFRMLDVILVCHVVSFSVCQLRHAEAAS